MARAGKVYVQNEYVGRIYETDEGYEFAYDDEYYSRETAIPVSLTFPLSEQVYKSNTLFSFFDGLIPEGWLLGIVERNWKIDGRDRFGLLLAACRDCIGDVYIEAEE
ncbi:HipA N-terminal domain-containing protein [Pseudobutyrivibrio sp.]|uniref:HipA N-terminal domain-containing protein n=1 Tax=Pseudobutyrivibrio sp. TaxID=2014367 RepID=UPI001D672663|nr:HipA N-terminal domain-containing protein [Pseudobutyrivibrio sp.]MBE5909991.1 phosphatidylinositol kinase [Pseudobutyrivibrio sp.]